MQHYTNNAVHVKYANYAADMDQSITIWVNFSPIGTTLVFVPEDFDSHSDSFVSLIICNCCLNFIFVDV